ncbi:MAG: FIG01121868: Possible membrane protein, Rv0205, partial [uncultured Quadrisphaera sp.]
AGRGDPARGAGGGGLGLAAAGHRGRRVLHLPGPGPVLLAADPAPGGAAARGAAGPRGRGPGAPAHPAGAGRRGGGRRHPGGARRAHHPGDHAGQRRGRRPRRLGQQRPRGGADLALRRAAGPVHLAADGLRRPAAGAAAEQRRHHRQPAAHPDLGRHLADHRGVRRPVPADLLPLRRTEDLGVVRAPAAPARGGALRRRRAARVDHPGLLRAGHGRRRVRRRHRHRAGRAAAGRAPRGAAGGDHLPRGVRADRRCAGLRSGRGARRPGDRGGHQGPDPARGGARRAAAGVQRAPALPARARRLGAPGGRHPRHLRGHHPRRHRRGPVRGAGGRGAQHRGDLPGPGRGRRAAARGGGGRRGGAAGARPGAGAELPRRRPRRARQPADRPRDVGGAPRPAQPV